MELTIYILISLIALVIVKDIYLLIRITWFFRKPPDATESPFVSVLVAVRNEAGNIRDCLHALIKQNYPTGKIEILVGNDDSEDDTLAIANEMAREIPIVTVIDIKKLVVKAPGKMNVLVQLIEIAKGDIYLFTDGDTQVGVNWVATMSATLQSGYGVVTGTTLMKKRNIFERFQYLDWLQAQAMVKVLEDEGVRVTSLGNNMGVSKEAYDAVGGFRGVPFSITEDYELYQSIIGKGFKPIHIYNKNSIAISLPMTTIGSLLEQRKRWMYGVVRLPFIIIFFLLLNALFIPLLILLLFSNPVIGLLIGGIRVLVSSIFHYKLERLLGEKGSSLWLIPFEFYQSVVNLTTLIYFLLPVKARWKGRSF